MKIFNLKNFIGGWFIGDFSPTIVSTEKFEISVKNYKKGDRESSHTHLLAEELTVIAEGSVTMNGNIYKKGDIILIEKGEYTDFNAIEDSITVVVKIPSVKGDKYVADKS
jgi:quercetin dioxygenase-like cupin family protein